MARDARSVPGVIDSLSEGFAQINRVLWVLLLPVVLDLVLWVAPRISAVPLVDRWLGFSRQALSEYGRTAGQGGPVDPQSLEMARRWLEESPLANLLSFLTWNLANASVPTVVPSQRLASGQVVEVDSPLTFLALVVCLQLAGVFLGCVYLGIIGQQVRDGQPDANRLARQVWRYYLSVLGFIGVVLGIVLGVSIPLSIVVGILTLVAPPLAAIVYSALLVTTLFVGVWMLLYLFFLVDAIVVGELGPLAAVRSSVLVVRSNLGASLGLIALILLISLGMHVIWSALARQAWGMWLAILGNAYVASGLVAASMLFYRHRAAPR